MTTPPTVLPRLPRAALRRLLPPELADAIDGDLAELFSIRVHEHGFDYARRRYWVDVASVVWRAPGLTVGSWRRRTASVAIRSIATSFRHSIRGLWRRPVFSLGAALTLAIGIAASTAVFAVLSALQRQPETAQVGEDVVMVWGTNPVAGQRRDVVSGPTFLDLSRENQVLDGLAAFHFGDLTLRLRDSATVISTLEVTPDFFAVTGVRPAIGRGFVAADATASARPLVLSHGFWQRQFGGDVSVIGRPPPLLGQEHLVIGVLPPDFRFFHTPDVMTLLGPDQMAREERTYYFYWLVGKLKAGTSLGRAKDDLDRVMARIAAAHPAARGWEVTVERVAAIVLEPLLPAVRTAMLMGGLVLLAACANVASLLLTRQVARQREFAIRSALGASQGRVGLELLVEAGWLAAGGACMGVALAALAIALLNRLVPSDVAIAGSAGTVAMPPIALDGYVLLFAVAISAVATMLCGVAPALRASRREGAWTVVPGARGGSSGVSERRLMSLLVSFETAVATVLLIVAALLAQSVWRLNAIDPGFSGEGVVAMAVGRVDDLDARGRAQYYTEVLRRVAATPGVSTTALNDYLLLTNEDDYEGVEIEARERLASGQWPREEWRRISPEYFRALRIPIVRGRALTIEDTAESPSVVVINEAMARKYWPGEDPLGRRLRLTAAAYGWSQIVGIAGDVREVGLDQPAKPMLFVPYHRAPRPVMALLVRLDSDSDAMIRSIQHAIWSLDPTRPVYGVRRVGGLVADSMAARLFAERAATIAAALALLLAAGGVYGTLTHGLARDWRDIGVRVAVGATRRAVVLLVLRQGVRPALAGLGAGLATAVWMTSVASRQLYDISPFDTTSYALSAAVILIVAAAACALPAWRASRVDPAVTLRAE